MVKNLDVKIGLLSPLVHYNYFVEKIFDGVGIEPNAFGDHRTLNEYGLQAYMTHLAALRGGDYDKESHFDRAFKKFERIPGIKNNIGCYALSNTKCIGYKPTGEPGYCESITSIMNGKSSYCIRPYIQFSKESEFNHYTISKITGKNCNMVNLGSYPLYAPTIDMINKLEDNPSGLEETNLFYTLPGIKHIDISKIDFFDMEHIDLKNARHLKQYKVYQYEGRRFIRIELDNPKHYDIDLAADINMEGKYNRLYIWLEDTPVWWIVDEENQALVSRDCLLSGVDYREIEKFLNNYMLRELLTLPEVDEKQEETKRLRAEELVILGNIAKEIGKLGQIRGKLGESTDVVEFPEDKGIQIVFKKNKQ